MQRMKIQRKPQQDSLVDIQTAENYRERENLERSHKKSYIQGKNKKFCRCLIINFGGQKIIEDL